MQRIPQNGYFNDPSMLSRYPWMPRNTQQKPLDAVLRPLGARASGLHESLVYWKGLGSVLEGQSGPSNSGPILTNLRRIGFLSLVPNFRTLGEVKCKVRLSCHSRPDSAQNRGRNQQGLQQPLRAATTAAPEIPRDRVNPALRHRPPVQSCAWNV